MEGSLASTNLDDWRHGSLLKEIEEHGDNAEDNVSRNVISRSNVLDEFLAVEKGERELRRDPLNLQRVA
jgi:hypothetical protein